jgi:hypothetical protein
MNCEYCDTVIKDKLNSCARCGAPSPSIYYPERGDEPSIKQEDEEIEHQLKQISKTKYCKVCGSELNQTLFFVTCAPSTGEKLFKLVYKCPNKKLYNFHTKFTVGDYSLDHEDQRLYPILFNEDYKFVAITCDIPDRFMRVDFK